jgi:hypothetical protein
MPVFQSFHLRNQWHWITLPGSQCDPCFGGTVAHSR